jgi:hypothetical protein
MVTFSFHFGMLITISIDAKLEWTVLLAAASHWASGTLRNGAKFLLRIHVHVDSDKLVVVLSFT